jgi:hypothetical protein
MDTPWPAAALTRQYGCGTTLEATRCPPTLPLTLRMIEVFGLGTHALILDMRPTSRRRRINRMIR